MAKSKIKSGLENFIVVRMDLATRFGTVLKAYPLVMASFFSNLRSSSCLIHPILLLFLDAFIRSIVCNAIVNVDISPFLLWLSPALMAGFRVSLSAMVVSHKTMALML